MNPDDLVERQQSINAHILDRVTSDPNFKQQLLDNPEQALQGLGVASEIEQIQGAIETGQNAEVVGHSHSCGPIYQGCGYYSTRWYCSGYGWKWGPWGKTL